MIEKIGNVELDLTFYNGSDIYTDGEIEDEILEIVKNTNDYESLLNKDNRWGILYHLSPIRENIINSFKFENTNNVLEIGSGCGAITGELLRKFSNVHCIDLSKKRSLINAYRHINCENLKIIIGNFEDIIITEKYNLITLIGVLEYAKGYINSSTPVHDFLKKIKNMMSVNGKLIIAIENKFGLKYWAGAREDHSGVFFEGLEGYQKNQLVKTFSYNELKKILNEVGFKEYRFLFPFPDYKFPDLIFSEERLPKIGELNNLMKNYDNSRIKLFNEEVVFNNIIESEYLNIFSNSFLLEIS